ncbi:hypothetical protein DFH07DRAFT_997847, partial [Mycena maculata]
MTSSVNNPSNPTRHLEYYLETVVFQVEDIIFRVPRSQFERHSEIFATTFTLPPASDGRVEGADEKAPVKLEGISSFDFQSLLKPSRTAIPKTPGLSQDEWISVLKLSTMWLFSEARILAIRHLTGHSLDCIQRILLGRQYDVSEWLRSGYTELARRSTSISSEEANKIG